LSSLELTEFLLHRIDKADPTLHAFTEVYAEQAQALARGADQQRAAGMALGPLHGLPIVLKDLLDIEGRIGTFGSRHFIDRRGTQTSATVQRLLEAGMVPLGKLHMTEFAFGGWGTNPLMQTSRNPWDPATTRTSSSPLWRLSSPFVCQMKSFVHAAKNPLRRQLSNPQFTLFYHETSRPNPKSRSP
jgi:aspartyl-tRNA(Asn)/glutamyl-tRNA(Gln) amidotransferase subunit A